MHKFRTSLAWFFALAMGLQLLPAFAVAAFRDVSASYQYKAAIDDLEEKGVVAGYADKTYRPDSTINRAELAKIVALMVATEAEADECLDAGGKTALRDVPASAWFAKYVCVLRDKEAIHGYPDGTFKGDQPITFVEIAKIVVAAFGQSAQGYGDEWYEPYALALESSGAIPVSVKKLDSRVTRGEMAEILWRLTEKKTDLASKAYMNLKYPEISVALGGDDVVTARSCADIRAFATEARTGSFGYARDMLMEGDAAGPPMAVPQAGESAGKGGANLSGGSDGDYSQTNIQVEGVDEADIVKTDGKNLYVVNRGASIVRVVRATPAGSMKLLSTLDLTDAGVSPQELYVENGVLTVVGQSSHWGGPMPMTRGAERMMIAPPYPYVFPRTVVRIYDVTDGSNPKTLRTLSFEGTQVSSRRIHDALYLVTQRPMNHWGPEPRPLTEGTEKDLLPLMTDSASGGQDKAVTRCGSVMIMPHVPSPEYLAVSTISLSDHDKEVKTSVVLGSAQNVYASQENLYVAAPDWTYAWDSAKPESFQRTRVYRFALDEAGAEFEAKGEVPGRILNQFSMDESKDHFRIATVQDGFWDGSKPSTTAVYVLNRALERVGAIEDIAPGETMYSSRFMGDRAYLVTFKKVDPFFVIDLSNPRAPRILGKLKIPGYSDYLHPYDENHVIGFGKEAVEAKGGDFAWYQGMKIAMFDVSDVADPKELHKTVIGDRGTDSPLLHDHKALLFDRNRGLLAFPVTVHELTAEQRKDTSGSAYGSPVFQGAYVYDVGLDSGFALTGKITHVDDPDAYLKMGDWFYAGDRAVERILRIGESLYTVSQGQVRAHSIDGKTEQGKLNLQ